MCVLTEVLDAVNVAASVATTVYSGIQNANYQKAVGEYRTNLYKSQAQDMRTQAKEEYQKGVEESRKVRLKSILNMGTLSANAAAGNLSLSSETVQNYIGDEKFNGELDALTTFENYKNRSDNYLQYAQNYYNNAALTSFATKQNYKSNLLSAFSNAALGSLKLTGTIADGIKNYKNK